MSFQANGFFRDNPFNHVPEVGDMIDFYTEKAYRFHKERRRDEPVYLIVPDGNNRRGTKFRLTCICYFEYEPGKFDESCVDCNVTVQNGVVVHVSVDYEYY